MTWWKDLAEAIQAIITSLGIIVAGIWAYLVFIRNRQGYPRVALDINIFTTLIPNEGRLIHVEVKIDNSSNVIVRSCKAELRLRKVDPIPIDIIGSVKSCVDPVPQDRAEIEWPVIACRNWTFQEGEFEIEPGETDCLHGDFMIESSVRVVEYYFYLSNAVKTKKGIGWTKTMMQLVGDAKEDGEMNGQTNKSDGLHTYQQKQQKPQIQQPQQQQQKPQQQPKVKK